MASDLTTQPRPRRKGRPAAVPRLVPLFSVDRVQTGPPVDIRAGHSILGRSETEADAGAFTQDLQLSRRHARLERQGERLAIEDLDSRNGTFVNGRRLDRRRQLYSGDLLQLGDTFLLVRITPPVVSEDVPVAGLLGRSPALVELRRTVVQVAESDVDVLVLGETGVGKGATARAIHLLSGRRGGFVPVNCGAIPTELAEGVLFGHVGGAFTGARRDSTGLLRSAEGGTLFLDEVGELPAAVQVKLLRFLDDHAVWPVGATQPVQVDVRVVAATNADLDNAVGTGAFRPDLHARLGGITVRIPPLRERREDVLELLQRRLGDLAPLDPELVAALLAWRWPYNVREVERVAGELRVRGKGLDRLPLELVAERLSASDLPRPPAGAPAAPVPSGPPGAEELAELLRAHNGVVADVARAIGRSRRQLYRWIQRHDLDPDAFRAP